jgi:hypothetical protein
MRNLTALLVPVLLCSILCGLAGCAKATALSSLDAVKAGIQEDGSYIACEDRNETWPKEAIERSAELKADAGLVKASALKVAASRDLTTAAFRAAAMLQGTIHQAGYDDTQICVKAKADEIIPE